MDEAVQKNFTADNGAKDKAGWLKLLVPAVLSIVLFLAAIWDIENFNQLLLYDDEFGYWTASAYLTGTDWKSVTSGIPYYSYGYGFLILTPIRLLLSSPAAMYRAAIVVNGLLLVGSFWIARKVAAQLFEDAHYALIDAVCFLVVFYPSNLVFAHIAWAECTLVFLFWVFVALSLRVIKKPTILNHVMMAVVVMGLYVVHQRTLAVAIATVMVMAWCFWADPGRRKCVIAFGVTMIVLILIHSGIKSDLIETFYHDNDRVAVNNMEGQTEKLGNLFTVEGFSGLIQSVIGKWLYLVIAGFMMFWWSMEALAKETKTYLAGMFAKKRFYTKRDLSEEPSLWYVWILLAFLGNFMIAAIYMCGVARNDMLLYGRYTEYMIGIYIVIGVFAFLKDDKWVPKLMAYVGSVIAMGLISQNILNKVATKSYQAYHSLATSLFLQKDKSAEGAVLGFAALGIALSVLVIILVKSNPWKKWNALRGVLVLAVVGGMALMISDNMVAGVMSEKQELRIGNIKTITSCIERMDQEGTKKVYFCADTESRYWSESFQFLMPDRPITVIQSRYMEEETDGFYIVGKGFLTTDGYSDSYKCIKKSNQFALVVLKDTKLAENGQ